MAFGKRQLFKMYINKFNKIMENLESLPEDDWNNDDQTDALHCLATADKYLSSKSAKEVKLFNEGMARIKKIFVRPEDEAEVAQKLKEKKTELMEKAMAAQDKEEIEVEVRDAE